MLKVSIIIPTKDRLDLLKETIQSLLHQTLQPDEIIVVDNGSSDGTYNWLVNHPSKKIICIQNKSINTSPGRARNIGFQAASCSHVKFFDSDDLMTGNTLECQFDVLEKSGKGLVYSPYFRAIKTNGAWESPDNVLLNYYPFKSDVPLTEWMYRGLFIAIPGMLFKRDLLKEVGQWREDLTTYEDWDYLWRIAKTEPYPAHTNACAFLYRQHAFQSTDRHTTSASRNLEGILGKESAYRNEDKVEVSWVSRQLFVNQYKRMLVSAGKRKGLMPNEVLWWWYWRMAQKYGRWKSRSDWQPCYGPLVSREKIDEYISTIPC